MFSELKEKKRKLAVIGLGYVGLPIALAFAKKLSVVGFDINNDRVDLMKKKVDPSNELPSSAFDGCDILFTSKLEDLKDANFFVVAVPTPVDKHASPNLKPLISASETVGKVLKKGDYVVYESTVYPGCTEDDCVPILEKHSGLKAYSDFKVGYSPERINPGDKKHTLEKITKVIAGNDDEALEVIAKVYELIIDAGVHRATSIKVAEAAKVIENTQRDLNIALMNELSKIFDKIGINTFDVLEAAGTKWNFLKFEPGLVGGHCIGVDPYYLTYKAEELGYHPQVILSGRNINDTMSGHIAKVIVQKLAKLKKDISESKVLVLGATFKEDVSDIRNSKVVDLIKELVSFGVDITTVDPHASEKEFYEEYKLNLQKSIPNKDYDAIVFAVPHKEFLEKDPSYFKNLGNELTLFVDIKGKLRSNFEGLNYWSL